MQHLYHLCLCTHDEHAHISSHSWETPEIREFAGDLEFAGVCRVCSNPCLFAADVGRSCILVSLGGKNVMLDCGMHMGFNDQV